MLKIRISLLFFFLSTILVNPALSQWMTQTIPLQPGWNAVFFEVQPEPNECDIVFRDLPVESVWKWNRQFSSVQFIQDSTTLVPKQPEWMVYFPPESGKNFLTDLFIIQGSQSYIIKISGNQQVNLNVKGKPVVRSIDWISDSFNLAGFHVDPDSPPTFQSFFTNSAAHAGQPVYRLNVSGKWEAVSNLATEKIEHGKAYQVFCKGVSAYSGPIAVDLEQGNGLEYGRILTELTLRIKNETSMVKSIIISPSSSEQPPNSRFPSIAGDVLLSYYDTGAFKWIDLTGEFQTNIQPKKEMGFRLAVRRKDMPADLYQSLLTIKDGAGIRLSLPVSANGLGASVGGKRSVSSPDRVGLWVGMAAVDQVSHASGSEPVTPQPTASDFQFRLIFHVDDAGNTRLLQNVIQMWKEGTTKPDPQDPEKQIVDEPGRFVLVTRDELISQFKGAAVKKDKAVGRRISSAAFSFTTAPILMTGTFDGTLSGNITVGYDDPLNPFKHKYHPDHDNLDYDFKPYPQGTEKESFDILRKITLKFTADDPENLSIAGWGDNQLGGVYSEEIEGVHKKKIYVKGIFRLRQVSHVSVLNDGL